MPLPYSDYNRSIEMEPDNALTYRLRGSAYEIQGVFDLAIQDYDKSLELDPGNSYSYLVRGKAFYDAG